MSKAEIRAKIHELNFQKLNFQISTNSDDIEKAFCFIMTISGEGLLAMTGPEDLIPMYEAFRKQAKQKFDELIDAEIKKIHGMRV